MLRFDMIQINDSERFSTYGHFEGNNKTIVIKTKDSKIKNQLKKLQTGEQAIKYLLFESEDGETYFKYNVNMKALHIENDMKGSCKILLG